MNPQEKQQVVAHDDKWVPFSERVKISSTNIRRETTMPQKEETFQVVIDLQFLYSIKKVQGTDSYKFLLANKKCTVNAEVFRIILGICLRVEGVDFTDVLDDDAALTFLIDLGYKGPLYKHTNMFLDHMHHPSIRVLSERRQEDIAYQIDHRKEKRSRRETCHIPDSPKSSSITS
ncbi:hypothetical protein Tco_0954392 [Tanacetum coccineum]|uniref:BTB domain-containing protein n=1 Tax=Tanacetum coccineum TaxID=301880 RepID=A0ABQ5E3T2_9ASTR